VVAIYLHSISAGGKQPSFTKMAGEPTRGAPRGPFEVKWLHRLVQFSRFFWSSGRNTSTFWKQKSQKGRSQARSLMSYSAVRIPWALPPSW
jgi:hypothetical protein